MAVRDGTDAEIATRAVDVALGRITRYQDYPDSQKFYQNLGNKYLDRARPKYGAPKTRTYEDQVLRKAEAEMKAQAAAVEKVRQRVKANVARVMSDANALGRKKKKKKPARMVLGGFSSNYSVPVRYVGGDDNSVAPLVNTFGKPKLMSGASPLVQAIFGHTIEGDPRWPDTFTMVPTSTIQSHTIIDLASTAGVSTYDRHLAFALAGSPTQTMRYAMTCAAFVPAWNTGTYASAGLSSASYLNRPIGITCCLTYKPIGTAHDISLSILPTEPILLSALGAAPTNWPTDVRVPLTTGQALAGARTFSMTSGDEICINLLPVDPLSVTFEYGSTARSADIAWTGAAVWAYGLADGDLLQAHLIYTEEYFALSAASSALSQGNPTMNPPNTSYLDKALTAVENFVGKGLQIYKTLEGWGSIMGQALTGNVLSNNLGMTMSTNPIGYLQNARRRLPKPIVDDEKEDKAIQNLLDRSAVLVQGAEAALSSRASSSSSTTASGIKRGH